VLDAESSALGAYREVGFPRDSTPWREVAFTVLDFETTGLDPASDEIISFGCVTVAGGKVRLDDARYELVRPNRMPDWDTIRIHGLREADLDAAPRLSERLDRLLEALTGRVLVAHVAAVERGFLESALGAIGVELRSSTESCAGSGGRRPLPPSPSAFRIWRARSACRCTARTTPTAMR
jgi:DNA polymerase III subunit epsilon